jgi:hypothetical protein
MLACATCALAGATAFRKLPQRCPRCGLILEPAGPFLPKKCHQEASIALKEDFSGTIE